MAKWSAGSVRANARGRAALSALSLAGRAAGLDRTRRFPLALRSAPPDRATVGHTRGPGQTPSETGVPFARSTLMHLPRVLCRESFPPDQAIDNFNCRTEAAAMKTPRSLLPDTRTLAVSLALGLNGT